MVFGADKSESDDELGDQDRELAYREEEAEIEEHAHVCLLRDGAGLNVGRHLPHSEERPVPVSACRRTGRAESPRAYERGGVNVYQLTRSSSQCWSLSVCIFMVATRRSKAAQSLPLMEDQSTESAPAPISEGVARARAAGAANAQFQKIL